MAFFLLSVSLLLLLVGSFSQTGLAGQLPVRRRVLGQLPIPTPRTLQTHEKLKPRDDGAIVSTCGFKNGDPDQPRTANDGFDCRVDTANGLWGFCPTTVIAATDCGLAGYCVDSSSCSSGCGRLEGRTDITTFTCSTDGVCSTALLINGPDQTYEYIACGQVAVTDSLFAVPVSVKASTTTQSTSTSSSTPVPKSSSTTRSSTSTLSSSGSSSTLSSSPSVTSGPQDTTSASSSTKSSSTAPIVGGTVGGLALVCLTVLGVFFLRGRQSRQRNRRVAQNTQEIFDLHSEPRPMYPEMPRWDSSYGPLELSGPTRKENPPVELPNTNFR